MPHGSDRRCIVELAGLAAAGKTTIARALAALDPGIRARPHVAARSYLASVLPLVPVLVGLHRPFRRVLSKEIKRVVRLRALHRVAQRTAASTTLLFDEGPVYLLARILVYGGANIRTAAFARWWRGAIIDWAMTLDVIVWLDAPDDALTARIRTRPQWHPMQQASEQELARFLQSYRAAYARVVEQLTAAGSVSVWTIATAGESPGREAAELLTRLQERRGITAPVAVRA